jgi:adenylate kinase
MSSSSPVDLEVKDANFIFRSVWEELEKEYGNVRLRFPHEIIWLGGAPGAGKGTNTPYIQKVRGFTAPPIVISSLLDSPEMKQIKDAGMMVGDKEVINLLLRTLLDPIYESGVIVDGFPRTMVQVNCLKLFYHKMLDLRNEFINTPYAEYFRYPCFRIALLFVEEKVSVERQMKRGRETIAENEARKQSGRPLLEERKTDFDENLARKRYQVFKEQTYSALISLKDLFHYHFINAEGTIAQVQQNIEEEFKYQSSLDLNHETAEKINIIPLASEISIHARHQLIKRLEGYVINQPIDFEQIIQLINKDFLPVIRNQAISGKCIINTDNILLTKDINQSMVVDILSERGYHVTIDEQIQYIPERIDPNTYKITCTPKKIFNLYVDFPGNEIRRGY